MRWHVVDDQDFHTVALPDGVQLGEQPFAVRLGYFVVACAARRPATEQGFGGHHANFVLDGRDDLEAPVEDQGDPRKALVQRFDDADQPLLLRLLIEIREQPVGIQRVEKEAAVALVPERSDNLVGKELRPLGRRLVDDFRVPVGVFR